MSDVSVKRKFKNGEDLANALPSLRVGERVIYHGVEHEVIDAGEQGKRDAALRDEKAEGDVGERGWVRLADLVEGALFETKDGTRAVKSEYYYDNDNPQPQCILLASGEYAHFPKKGDTLVREIVIPEATTQHPEPVSTEEMEAGREPVAVVDSGEEGLFVEILFGDDGSPLKIGDKLFTAPPPDPEALRLLCELSEAINDYYGSGMVGLVGRKTRLTLARGAAETYIANQQEKGRD